MSTLRYNYTSPPVNQAGKYVSVEEVSRGIVEARNENENRAFAIWRYNNPGPLRATLREIFYIEGISAKKHLPPVMGDSALVNYAESCSVRPLRNSARRRLFWRYWLTGKGSANSQEVKLPHLISAWLPHYYDKTIYGRFVAPLVKKITDKPLTTGVLLLIGFAEWPVFKHMAMTFLSWFA